MHLVLAAAAATAAVPSDFAENIHATGLSSPTAMAFAPDGRLFVCELAGRVRIVHADGQVSNTPFVDLAGEISTGGERGLLGIAFDPAFADNGFVYIFYAAAQPSPHNRVSRFTAAGDVAQAGSKVVLFELDALGSTSHGGGALGFGGDGMLYVTTGDNKQQAAVQDPSKTHGKLLRLRPEPAQPIPSDNPYSRGIWALGFRNPFTLAVHPDGRVFVNDVGETSREEINLVTRGANLGWPRCEGACSEPGLVSPVYSYGHGDGCAITGGTFYPFDASGFPSSYAGRYFFADFCNGWVRQVDLGSSSGASSFSSGHNGPVDLDVGPDGALYILEHYTGEVTRIAYAPNRAAFIAQQPADARAGSGQSVSFRVGAGGSAPLFFQWQRDGVDIGGATSTSYVLPVVSLDDDGAAFRVRVWNALGSALSRAATLTVDDSAPVGVILSPVGGTRLWAARATSRASRSPTPGARAIRRTASSPRAPSPGTWTCITTPPASTSIRRSRW
jgi:glucose/arabinose dehydrogenase